MPLLRSSNCFTQEVRTKIISQLILPIIDSADVVYCVTFDSFLKPLNVLFRTLCRFILNGPYRTHHCDLCHHLSWVQPGGRRQCHWLQFIFKCVHLNFSIWKTFSSQRHHLILWDILSRSPSLCCWSHRAGSESFLFQGAQWLESSAHIFEVDIVSGPL